MGLLPACGSMDHVPEVQWKPEESIISNLQMVVSHVCAGNQTSGSTASSLNG